MTYQTGTLTGTVLKPDGTLPPARTQVHITPNVSRVRDEAGNVILTGSVAVELDDDGAFSVVLAATNDATLDPTGFAYTVDPRLKGWQPITGVAIPAGTTVKLSSLFSGDPAAPTYAPWIYGEGQTFTEDPPGSGLYDIVDGGTDRLVEDPDNPGLYDIVSAGVADDRVVTLGLDGHLPTPVETRIGELADALGSAAAAQAAAATDATTKADAAQAAAIAAAATDATSKVATETTRATNAEALKAPIASPTFTGTVSGVTKAMVGLGNVDNLQQQPINPNLTAWSGLTSGADKLPYFTGSGTATTTTFSSFGRALVDDADATTARGTIGLGNVDNTADTAKPVSTAQQTALNLKANLASPTFTGTVGGITKSMVGLGNVDNTSDANKPVSTAQAAAIAAIRPAGFKFNLLATSAATTNPGSGNARFLTGGGSLYINYTDADSKNRSEYLTTVFGLGGLAIVVTNGTTATEMSVGAGADNGTWAELILGNPALDPSVFTSGQPIYLLTVPTP